jgi:hypothetical protein
LSVVSPIVPELLLLLLLFLCRSAAMPAASHIESAAVHVGYVLTVAGVSA